MAANLSAMLASTKARLLIITRYPGQLFTDIVTPIVMASMPILVGRSVGGDDPGAIFAANTGTENYVAYMMIGAATFSIVSMAMWHIAYWLRWEMETGTLEMLYLTPTERIWVAAGTAIYSIMRGLLSGTLAYVVGSFVLGVNPFQGELLLALAFIFSGLIPLYSMTLFFGALVLKLKEANALINLMQWGVAFLMGAYYPVAVLPPLARALALAFPPTWMTNGVRSAILGVGYFFGNWYRDLGMLWVFMLIAPLLGYQVFTRVEKNVRRNEGIGTF